jgi:molybdate transport repressor ModE-like protein
MKMRYSFWIEVEGKVALSIWRVAPLEAVEATGSISGAGQTVGVHFRVAWRKIKEVEQRLGVRLVAVQGCGRRRAALGATASAARVLMLAESVGMRMPCS